MGKAASGKKVPPSAVCSPAAEDDAYENLYTPCSARSLFLYGFAAIYVSAFASYWLQYPGTFGEDGLTPVKTFWDQVKGSESFKGAIDGTLDVPLIGKVPVAEELVKAARSFVKLPSFLWFSETLLSGIDIDTVMEGTALGGISAGCLALFGFHHVSVFAVAFLCYCSLFAMGQIFLGFQWDTFLLETGAALLLYAPWWSQQASSPQPAAAWILRAQWVKFMIMSGVVKVTADCPTWKNLTALEFHFASTCLPTSEAWIHHQLPPIVLRLGVAVMFLLEVIAPWLLLAPMRPVRHVGVLIQIPFQLAIMITGNYNWFNLHTIVLLLPAWEADFDLQGKPFSLVRPLLALPRFWEKYWRSWFGTLTASFMAVGILTYFQITLFPIEYRADKVLSGALQNKGWLADALGLEALYSPDAIIIKNKLDEAEVKKILGSTLTPITYLVLYAMMGVCAIAHALSPPPGAFIVRLNRCLWRLILGALCMLYLGVTLIPLQGITTEPEFPFKQQSQAVFDSLERFHISNGYGLFRRMTGVSELSQEAKYIRWGGRAPSVVGVPAVVIEARKGQLSEWKEIPFRYAPYGTERAPRRTAPHQPRIDWQMWFAALGSYGRNHWFVHLLWKILIGSPDVIDLLDTDEYPFKDEPPTEIRAALYHYDFTRLQTPWAMQLSRAGRSVDALPKVINATRGSHHHTWWWSRVKKKDYFPAVNKSYFAETAVKQRWPLLPKRRQPFDFSAVCTGARKRASEATDVLTKTGTQLLQRGCEAVSFTRAHGAPLRRFVGWKFEMPVYATLWSGTSTSCFVDGPLVTILCLCFVPLFMRTCLHFICRLVFSSGGGGATTAGKKRRGNKVKNE
eukprot:TRINITY_DN9815_c0_g2_i1.p1 TRINITY_DN9815_c0_g2~~TRINITY_DN9815_c0_g2_i1.p1  ORF type:complete len:851 (-),score=79.60 TRINITY_DN9815_c0_g2_i1:142-2694(-)